MFLAQLRPKGNARPSVVLADHGHMEQQADGSQTVVLDKGTRFEGTAMLRDFRITDFTQYQAVMGYKEATLDPNDSDQASLSTLWHNHTPAFRAELNWRLTLIFSVLVMALMVVPLSVVNPRQGRVLSMLPAMLLYLIFFLVQSSFRSNATKGRLDPAVWMWSVNAGYFVLAIVLNLWDTLPMRRFRARFSRSEVA
ncbi:Lipopolysaccharide export system permease protein lptF [Tatumella ptyseos]|uniref:Lipopolysaccharide export system permease protein lptF n=1 Tax=Tatumella ptyseos TaxID=82987 RepID=A0A2X5NG97_9GAMM|nr:Lipopolysaccharide export system permease protein lptF [Tatumella ptyseos]